MNMNKIFANKKKNYTKKLNKYYIEIKVYKTMQIYKKTHTFSNKHIQMSVLVCMYKYNIIYKCVYIILMRFYLYFLCI